RRWRGKLVRVEQLLSTTLRLEMRPKLRPSLYQPGNEKQLEQELEANVQKLSSYAKTTTMMTVLGHHQRPSRTPMGSRFIGFAQIPMEPRTPRPSATSRIQTVVSLRAMARLFRDTTHRPP